jgi:hypothetical protein
MKVGDWVSLAILLGMLSATIWIAYDIWKTTADVPISENGYIALGVGAAITIGWLRADGAAVLQTPSRIR